MTTVYSGYSAGWKPVGSDIYKKYRARLDYSLVEETPTTITYKAILYVNINSSVNASYSGTLNISGSSYSGSCKTVFGETNTVTCVSAKTKTFTKGTTATTATIKGSVKSSNGSWTGKSVVASATVTIPALAPATITFNANGGSGTVAAINTYVGVATTIPSNSFTRTGYTFNGWNTSADGTGTSYAAGSTVKPTGDMTLYAQWQSTYVKPTLQNIVAFRVANASGETNPDVTSSGTTGFCRFELVGGNDWTVDSAMVKFGTQSKAMTKSGNMLYGYSDVGSISEANMYSVVVIYSLRGADGIIRTYEEATYISKSTSILDISASGLHVVFGGNANDNPRTKNLYEFHGDVNIDGDLLAKEVADTGWQEVTFTSNFKAYSDKTTLKYRKIGKTVQIQGAITPTKTLTLETTDIAIAEALPEEYRPAVDIITICQGSSTNIWTCRVSPTGVISAERYRSGSTYVKPTAGNWFPINITYFVD